MRPGVRGVVLAAGGGARLMPLTARRPKPMLPVAGKPLLAYNLELLAGAGVEQAVVVISPQGEMIARHFGDRFLSLNVRYIIQAEARGTGHALSLVRDAIGDEPFFCIFGDNLTRWPVTRLRAPHWETAAAATVAVFRAPDPRRHGVVETEGQYIRAIVEKPERPPSDLACAGMFYFEPDIFAALEAIPPAPNGELQLPDAIRLLIHGGRPVAYAEVDRWRININTAEDLLEANHRLLAEDAPGRRHPRLIPPVAAPEEIAIEPAAKVGPFVSCGRGCRIEVGARVAESILLDGVTIGAGAQVERAILGDGVRVAAGAVVRDRTVTDSG